MSATTLEGAYGYPFGGRWSFTLGAGQVPQPAFVAPDLLSVTMEAPQAQPWVVNQSAFQYQGGTIGDPTFPARNQVDARGYYMQVTWGVDGATETALVDYRPSGGSFQLQASTIRVAIMSDVAADPSKPVPVLAGSISPGERHCSLPPTFTTRTQTALANGGRAIFAIPPRAVAYRVYVEFPGAGVDQELTQLSPDFIRIQLDAVSVDPGDQEFMGLPENRAQWYPISPRAQFVAMRNTNPTIDNAAHVQFVLDLG